MNLIDMMAYHRRRKAQATIALTRVENPCAFGVVETNERGKVQKFIEKPAPGTETSNWINAGTYILEREVLNVIPPGCNYMFERGLFPQLLQTGRPVYGYPYKGYWLDMGTPALYHTVSRDFMNSKIPNLLLKNTGKAIYDKKYIHIHKTAKIQGVVVIGNGFIAGEGAEVNGPTTIGKECRLGDNTIIEDSIIWDGVTIGANTRIKRCIISSGTMIPDNQILENIIITPGQTLPLPEA